MMQGQYISYFKGKLVRTMLFAMFIALIIFMGLSITFTRSGINQLKEDLSSNLNDNRESIKLSLDNNLGNISKSVERAKVNTSTTLSTFLSSRLKNESTETKKMLHDAILKNAEVLADTLSKVSVETILSRNFSTLTSYVKVANKDPNVIYAYFLRPNGKPFTRYVNRKNPKVKALLAIGKGRTPMEKLLEATAKDENIIEISRSIDFEGKQIASIKVAVSIEELNQKIDKLVENFETLVTDSNNKINQVLDAESIKMFDSLKKGFEKINSENELSTRRVLSQVEISSFDLLKKLSVMMAIGGIIVLLLLGLFFIVKVITPMFKLTQAMNDLGGGKGDLSFRLPEEGNDEFTKVAVGFNKFVAKIESLVEGLSVKAVNLDELVLYVSDSASHSSTGMARQQEETAKIITSVEELTSIVHSVTEKTAQAAEGAKDADLMSEQGIKVVHQTVEKIEDLAQAVNKAGTVVQRVEEDSNRISTVLEVIRGIAEQTNLLALNAAIEAARAGEQGRGFAVVADEVRTLAQRSHEATEEIQEMINNLQSGVSEAVQVMLDSQERAVEGVSGAKQAGHALADIKKAIDIISEMNIQIAESSVQQQSLTEEVNQGTLSIGKVAKQTTEDAQSTTRASSDMSDMVEQLIKLVKQFHLENNILFELENAKVKHIGWKNRLTQFLSGYGSMEESEAANHKNCAFGQWYYSSGIKNYSHIPQIKQIEQPHKDMHDTIHKIIRLKNSGNDEEAQAEMANIDVLSKQIVDLITQIIKQVKQ
jgi:methyl-accepting chemotaxis protein